MSPLFTGPPPSSDLSATVQVVKQGFEVCGSEKLNYAFKFVSNVFDESKTVLSDCYTKWGRVLVVMDGTVEALYGQSIKAYFAHHSITCTLHVMPGGELHKTMTTMLSLVDAFDKFGLIRKEPVLVVGGGLVTDVTGYACASYRRSSNFIRVPTTLIGLIDAAVSIKVAVNHGKLKNRLGAYHAPMLTILDFDFLATLPQSQIRNGFAELIKIASVADLGLWNDLVRYGPALISTAFGRRPFPTTAIEHGHLALNSSNGNGVSTNGFHKTDKVPAFDELTKIADSICYRGIKVMLDLETPNLHEIGLDRVIAFGHTWSPTLELTPAIPLRHGHAIIIDMAFTVTLAWMRGYITDTERFEFHKLAHDVGLSLDHVAFDNELLLVATTAILKTRDGKQRFAAPRPMGTCFFINDASHDELCAALQEHKKMVARIFPDLKTSKGVGLDAYVDSQDLGMDPALLLSAPNGLASNSVKGVNGIFVDGDSTCGC